MSYTIKPVTQYAVINDDMPIAVCKDQSEATVNMMAGHTAKPYTFSDWARKR